ncbi:MAG: hypothetical protein JNK04_26515, partial [Myxococcales bacterium]|nr:hypothetical protein [Myxococcales bacterium]
HRRKAITLAAIEKIDGSVVKIARADLPFRLVPFGTRLAEGGITHH